MLRRSVGVIRTAGIAITRRFIRVIITSRLQLSLSPRRYPIIRPHGASLVVVIAGATSMGRVAPTIPSTVIVTAAIIEAGKLQETSLRTPCSDHPGRVKPTVRLAVIGEARDVPVPDEMGVDIPDRRPTADEDDAVDKLRDYLMRVHI